MQGWQWFLRILVIIMLFATVGCGGKPASISTPAKPEATKFVIKAAHATSTDYPYHIGLLAMAKSLVEKTGGRAELQIFPNGQLGGNEAELLTSLQLGQIAMTVVNGAVISQYTPKADVFNLPFIFRDYSHLYKVLDGEPGRIVADELKTKNLKVLTWYVNPERYIFTTKKPITSLSDMKGLKIRVTQSPVAAATFAGLGAVPVPMAFGELYAALQQGIIDGGESDWFAIRGMKFYEVAPQIALTGHFMVACPLLVSRSWFNSLPLDIQKAVQESAVDGTVAMRSYMEQDLLKIQQELKAKNITITKISDMDAWQNAVEPVYKQFEVQIGKELIDMVIKIK